MRRGRRRHTGGTFMEAGGEAVSTSIDSRRAVDGVVGVRGSALWIASLFSVKWEAKSSVENEDRGKGVEILRGKRSM